MNIAMLVASALTALAIVAHGPTASAQTRVPASPAKTGASSAGDVSQQQEPRQLAKSALQEAASKPRLLASFSASPNGFEDPTVLATDRQILLANRRTNHVAFWDFLEGRAVERLQAAQGMMVFSATLSPDESQPRQKASGDGWQGPTREALEYRGLVPGGYTLRA